MHRPHRGHGRHRCAAPGTDPDGVVRDVHFTVLDAVHARHEPHLGLGVDRAGSGVEQHRTDLDRQIQDFGDGAVVGEVDRPTWGHRRFERFDGVDRRSVVPDEAARKSRDILAHAVCLLSSVVEHSPCKRAVVSSILTGGSNDAGAPTGAHRPPGDRVGRPPEDHQSRQISRSDDVDGSGLGHPKYGPPEDVSHGNVVRLFGWPASDVEASRFWPHLRRTAATTTSWSWTSRPSGPVIDRWVSRAVEISHSVGFSWAVMSAARTEADFGG